MTGNRPYSRLKSDEFVLGQIARGVPPLQESLDNNLWLICSRCWYIRPSERPFMREIISQLSEYKSAAYDNRGISGKKLDQPSAAHGLPDQNYPKESVLPARSRVRSY